MAANTVPRCLRVNHHYGYSTESHPLKNRRNVVTWQIRNGSEEMLKLLIACSRVGNNSIDAAMP
jgi:hypothetical protein